jgi:2-dehydropantoate 2-reductase
MHSQNDSYVANSSRRTALSNKQRSHHQMQRSTTFDKRTRGREYSRTITSSSSQPTPLSSQSTPNTTDTRHVPRRIHILGTGNIGKLVAHSLRDLPNPPPVTLLFHKGEYYHDWLASAQEIRITTNGITTARNGFDAELARPGWRKHGLSVTMADKFDPPAEEVPHLLKTQGFQEVSPPDEGNTDPIDNLIVTVKAPQTVSALLAIRQRLGPDTSILFLQNGMGIMDEVNEKVFPDPSTRPNYMLGIISHGVSSHAQGRFAANHNGMGTIGIGLVPRTGLIPQTEGGANGQRREPWPASSRYLLRTVGRSPVLAAVGVAPTEILQAQLEKLAINAIINPITALVDARNGAVMYNHALSRVMRLLLAEISLVILSMPELKALPNLATRFSTDRLETLIVAVANKTANNISSMLADVRQGRTTEINYINGYIVSRGEELGITCFMNYMMVQLVKGKHRMVDRERMEELPLARYK